MQIDKIQIMVYIKLTDRQFVIEFETKNLGDISGRFIQVIGINSKYPQLLLRGQQTYRELRRVSKN